MIRSRLLALLVLSLLASPLAAETVVTCGTDEPTVPTRVTFYAQSVHGPAYPGSLIDPDLSAVEGLPWQQWKCSGGNVVPMSAQDLADLAAADLAARQAQALAIYGQAGCDLQAGDENIGQCADASILTSGRFRDAVLDVVKRHLSVEHGEYLVRWNGGIIGAPALPGGAYADGAPAWAMNGTEQAIPGATITVPIDTPLSRVSLDGVVQLTKDGTTTARVVTVRVRRSSDQALIGRPCVVRSQAIAGSDMGQCALHPVDPSPPAGASAAYVLTATSSSGAPIVATFTLRGMQTR